MTVTRNDAATALHDVDSARRHSLTLFKYGLAGPYLLLWGVLWIVADAVGAGLAALALGLFHLTPAHVPLMVPVLGGGALILGGLWMRSAR